MMIFTSRTACNIKSWMALRNVSNGMIAKAHPDRVSKTMVSYVINGKRTSAPLYKTIAALCGIQVDELLAGPHKDAPSGGMSVQHMYRIITKRNQSCTRQNPTGSDPQNTAQKSQRRTTAHQKPV